MTSYYFRIIYIKSAKLCAFMCHKLVTGAVSAISSYTIFLIISIWKSIHIGIVRHSLMISRIECNDLRNFRKCCLHSSDTKNMSRIVKRSKITAYSYLLHNILINKGAFREELASVDYTMTYSFYVIQ